MSRYSPEQLAAKYHALAQADKKEVSQLVEFLYATALTAQPAGDRSCKVTGRLVHSEKPHEPLHDLIVELWDREFLHPDQLLGRGRTDEDGRFEIFYTPGDAKPRLDLRVFDTYPTYLSTGDVIERLNLIHHGTVEGTVATPAHDLGQLEVAYWEYSRSGRLPRVLVPPGLEPPQDYAQGRKTALQKNMAEFTIIKLKHDNLNRVNPNWPSLSSIQSDFPENLTLRLERERPGYTRSDEFLGERVMNGFNPLLFSRDRSHPDWYRVCFNWDAYEMNGRYDLPNVDARFELRAGKLYPVQITLQFRAPGALAPYSPMQEPVTYTPADGEPWLQAKRIFRMVWGVNGELDVHLALTHVNTEQYAIAAWRNLRKNPVRLLLFPHLKEVVIINNSGEGLIFGPNGILASASGLTANAIMERFEEKMGFLDWTNWRPRRPISEHHTFARAGQLYWEVLTAHVDEFFATHHAEIVSHWREVHRFSQDLVGHSVAYRPPAVDPLDDWFDDGELDDPTLPRAEVGGIVRAVRPITQTDTPGPQDLENLKQACRYIIFQATFVHSYANQRQFDDGGEVLYLSLGLRNGSMSPESDLSIAPRPIDASNSLFIARFLSETKYGTIVKNEDGDIPPRFVELLRSRRADFEAFGFDIGEIASRINI